MKDCSCCINKDICKYKEQHMAAVTLMVEHESFYDKDIAECKYYMEGKDMDGWKHSVGEAEEGETTSDIAKARQQLIESWSELKGFMDEWLGSLAHYEYQYKQGVEDGMKLAEKQIHLRLSDRESDMIKMYRLMQPDSQMIIFSMVRKFYDMDYPNGDGTEL